MGRSRGKKKDVERAFTGFTMSDIARNTTTTSPHDSSIREASTLVIAARDQSLPQNTDRSFEYRILLLQRQGRSGSFAGASVFPGGVVDSADFSPKWYQLFNDLGIETGRDFGWDHMKDKPRAGPIRAQRQGGLLPNDVAFRICAIRETFEESGILLAGRVSDVLDCRGRMDNKMFAPSVSFRELEGLSTSTGFEHWRKAVHDDAHCFLKMCLEFGVYPNIWSIYQLGNVMTPSTVRKRYDTMFYICSLETTPKVDIDHKEMTNFRWVTPAEAIRLQARHEIDLPLPQINECARLMDFKKLSDVQGYGAKIMDQGMDTWIPIILKLNDALIRVLPGDDCYPESLPESLPLILNENLDENVSKYHRFNRHTLTSDGHFMVTCNIELPYGQHAPCNINSRDWADDSKL